MAEHRWIDEEMINKVKYECSAEHKDFFHISWGNPHPRPDIEDPCPRELSKNNEQILSWLKEALERGTHEDSRLGYPRYVWYYSKELDMVFEGRLTEKVQGIYKGYPLKKDEWPKNIKERFA